MTGTPGNPLHPRRCSAQIVDDKKNLRKRASESTELRCLRVGSVEIDGRWYCYAHAPAASRR